MHQKSPVKLNIRRMCPNDLVPLNQLLSDEAVMRYLEPPFSMEQTKEFLHHAALSDPPLVYAVEDCNRSFLGYVIYHDYDSASKEIGWVLSQDAWGKGYASILTVQLMEWAAVEGKSVVIKCVPEQSTSKHIAEKFGFRYIGKSGHCDVYYFHR